MRDSLTVFKDRTGYDISVFFQGFTFFMSNHYANIVNYYNGADIKRDSFVFLEYLIKETEKIEPIIDQYSNSFDNIDFWNINNLFSDIQSTLDTCINMGKWQRSSRLDRFSQNLKIEHIQKQNETLEKIARDSGFVDVNKWAELAISNQLEEESYTNKGGALLSVTLPNNFNFNLENIVDFLIGDNIYGKDIEKEFKISDDGGLITVSGKNNVRQIFETILSTYRGGIPEFPDDGMPNEIFGSNENVIQYPILFRSLLNMLQKDKRFTAFDILDIRKEQDSIFIELQVKTIMGETLKNNIVI